MILLKNVINLIAHFTSKNINITAEYRVISRLQNSIAIFTMKFSACTKTICGCKTLFLWLALWNDILERNFAGKLTAYQQRRCQNDS